MFCAERSWDAQSIANFQRKRDEERYKNGLQPFHTLEAKAKAEALKEEKDSISSNDKKRLTLWACPLEKYPLQAYIATTKGYLICPQILRGKSVSSDKLPFKEGDNLFLLVYNHYSKKVTRALPGQNYISNDGISACAHEFLGPSPCVSGFLKRGDAVEILFYDSYICLAWVHESTWDVSPQFDENVEAWVPVISTASD